MQKIKKKQLFEFENISINRSVKHIEKNFENDYDRQNNDFN